jgi:hypothetical protein
MMLQSLQPTTQVSMKSIHNPDTLRDPPSSKPISTKSFYRPKRLGGGGVSPPKIAENGDDEGKGKETNLSQTILEMTAEHSFSGDGAMVTLQEGNSKDCPPIGIRSKDDTSHLNNSRVETGFDQSQRAIQGQKNELHDIVGRVSTNISDDHLHELLLHDFCNGLTLLRESTLKVLQISHQEKERLCLERELLEARVAYMRHKIGSTRDQLLKRGVALEEDPDDLRACMAEEGEESPSSSGQSTDFIEKSANKEPITPPTESLQSKGCSKSEDFGARTSILRSLNWLSRKTQNQSESSTSSDVNYRLTFFDAGCDGMPSRWEARERERANKIKQIEEVENQTMLNVTRDEKMGDKNKNDNKAPELILKKEKEISVLEKRASTLELDTLSMRDEVSTLLEGLERTQSEFQRGRTQLLGEIDRIELGNEKLDRVCLSERILLEERKMNIEILANELKGAREKLIQIQNERDRQQKRIALESRLSNDRVGSDGSLKSRNERRYSRLNSTISALTLDSLDLVDILEQV